MTRADTAERTKYLPNKIYILQIVLQHNRFYGTGYMLVILFVTNITVDYLHYGIFYQHVYITIVKYTPLKNMASDILLYFTG